MRTVTYDRITYDVVWTGTDDRAGTCPHLTEGPAGSQLAPAVTLAIGQRLGQSLVLASLADAPHKSARK